MTKIKHLCDMKTGDICTVTGIDTDSDIRRRLQDMGLVKDTPVECLQKSPLGDPVAYLIRGAVIALRYEDSSKVLVKGGVKWDLPEVQQKKHITEARS